MIQELPLSLWFSCICSRLCLTVPWRDLVHLAELLYGIPILRPAQTETPVLWGTGLVRR